MARKKKQDKKPATGVAVTFVGGPFDAEVMDFRNPPLPFLRLCAGPGEWAHYFLRTGTLEYEYDMEREPIPHPYAFGSIAKQYPVA